MKLSTFMLCIVFLVFGIGVTALNSGLVNFNYYLSSIELPLSVLLIGVLVFGVVLGVLIVFGSVVKLKWENKGLKKKLGNLQAELSKIDTVDSL